MKKKAKKIILINSSGLNGGMLVISVLCKTLRILGYDARLLMTPGFPRVDQCKSYWFRIMFYQVKFWGRYLLCKFFPNSRFAKSPISYSVMNSIMEGCKYKYTLHVSKKNTIVIYPETQYGNPLGVDSVVRWLLYHYKYKNDEKAYAKTDVFVAFREVFNDFELNPKMNQLQINFFNNNLYRNYNNNKREGCCYILRKGKNRDDLPTHFDGPVFDDNMSQEELVSIFNRCKYCFSYDTQTFYTTIAAVCGCIPIVILEKGKNVSDYLSASEKHFGVAYGNTPEQIEYAINTRQYLLESLDYSEKNMKNTKQFIEMLENQFGTVKKI